MGSRSTPCAGRSSIGRPLLVGEDVPVRCRREMQVDVALSAELRDRHYPFSKLGGNANVLVFPNLAAGNIAYKMAECMGSGFVLGPFLVGLDSTVTLLSPSATASVVFQSAVVAAMRAGSKKAGEATLQ